MTKDLSFDNVLQYIVRAYKYNNGVVRKTIINRYGYKDVISNRELIEFNLGILRDKRKQDISHLLVTLDQDVSEEVENIKSMLVHHTFKSSSQHQPNVRYSLSHWSPRAVNHTPKVKRKNKLQRRKERARNKHYPSLPVNVPAGIPTSRNRRATSNRSSGQSMSMYGNTPVTRQKQYGKLRESDETEKQFRQFNLEKTIYYCFSVGYISREKLSVLAWIPSFIEYLNDYYESLGVISAHKKTSNLLKSSINNGFGKVHWRKLESEHFKLTVFKRHRLYSGFVRYTKLYTSGKFSKKMSRHMRRGTHYTAWYYMAYTDTGNLVSFRSNKKIEHGTYDFSAKIKTQSAPTMVSGSDTTVLSNVKVLKNGQNNIS